MSPMHPLWPDDTGSPLGDKVVPQRPAQDAKPEQWLPTSTPGYVRSNTTGVVKTETPPRSPPFSLLAGGSMAAEDKSRFELPRRGVVSPKSIARKAPNAKA